MLSSLIDPQHPARMWTPMQLDSSFSCKIENFQSPCEQILSGYATISLRVLVFLHVNSLAPKEKSYENLWAWRTFGHLFVNGLS